MSGGISGIGTRDDRSCKTKTEGIGVIRGLGGGDRRWHKASGGIITDKAV